MKRLIFSIMFFSFIGTFNSQASINCPSSLVHYWKMEESTGPPYIDSQGSANAVSATPPVQTLGIVDNAQYFDGTNEVDVAPNSTFDWGPNDSFTIEYWMKTNSITTGNRVIIGRDDAATFLHWWSGHTDLGIPTFYLVSTTKEIVNLNGSFDIRDNNWHHIAVTRNGVNDSLHLYVDGVLEDSKYFDYQDGFDSPTSNLNIGYLNLTNHFRYTGSIDELAIYNNALNSTEINAHHGNGFVNKGYCDHSIQIASHSQSVNSNSSIVLKVITANITELFASSVEIKFDNTMFQLLSVNEGDFLESNSGGHNTLFKSNSVVQSTMETLTVDAAILGRSNVSGTGELFNFVIKPLRAGTGNFIIQSVELRDLDNVPILTTSIDAEVIVDSPGPNTKIFLEGPYQTGAMTSLLPELGYLPLIQPFNTAPWNYNGFEKVDASFYTAHPEIVDWVLIELRTGTAENTTVAKRAAFLNEAGNLIDIDGVNPVSFFVNSAVQYYIVIRHRNHLDVMSSSLVDVNFASTLYDFTVASTNAYGTDALKEVDTGVFAMYTGDGNSDGIINGTDFNIYNPFFRAIANGYLTVDWDLNGNVTGTDFNYFNPNFRAVIGSQVP
ncbi:MAG: hypothetical protein HND52_16270 [Ignavibacteriae bacterium]|nr:hypothetical protein [Ignavibacteriota bacterium]NOG99513.1 hypothetical protein [Ignavibacteriota bacterium]